MLSIGIVLIALATLQIPIIDGFNLWDSVWVTSGGIGQPFLLAGLFTYLGARSLSRLINIRGWLTSVWVVLPAVIELCILSAFLPHTAVQAPEISLDISNAISVWSGLMHLTAAFMLARIVRTIGAHYRQTMLWLMCAFLTSGVIMVSVTVHALMTNNTQDVFTTILNVVGVIAGLFYLTAGYTFAKTEEY